MAPETVVGERPAVRTPTASKDHQDPDACADHVSPARVTVTSKLVAGVRRHRDDDQVVSTLANLPLSQDSHWDRPQRAGVANEEGEIYRYIVVSSAFELLQLTARLNAKGFSVSAELRHTRVGHYERIFTKVHPIRR